MANFEVFLAALFICVAGLNVLARWVGTPYPIALLLGGLALGAIPGVPHIELNPNLVLVIFLPPLLYLGGFFTDLRAFRSNMRVIVLLSIGLVIATAALVAVVAHHLIGLNWAMSWVLGAIVSPTDPLAATAVMRRLGVPRNIVNVAEGESLVNDASALVLYKVAVGAAVGGSFSLGGAALDLVGSIAGGIAIGLAVGWVVALIRRRLEDRTTELTISLLTGYAAFIPAEHAGVSGVLAVVTAGIYLGWRSHELASPETRLFLTSFWETLQFLLNATLFLLIGLQLPPIRDALQGTNSFGEVLGYGLIIAATVIVARFAWMFSMPYVIRALDRRPSQRARRVGWRMRVVGAWSGMRGGVSMAAALALPLATDAGTPLPGRSVVVFVTFVVIVVTLVGQGLTLPALIRKLAVGEDGSAEEGEEVKARLEVSRAAIAQLDQLAAEDWVRDDTADRLRRHYQFRIRRFKARVGKLDDDDGIEDRSLSYQRLLHMLYTAQREALVQLRNEGQISSDVMHRVERDLDLEETRLDA